MPTLEQLKEFLTSIGVPLPPDFILNAWLAQVAVIQPCLDGAGYDPTTQLLIYTYLLGLFAISYGNKYISSQTAPSGAAQSFRYNSQVDAYRGVKALLNGVDTSGCTDDLVPAEPGPSAGLWVSKGGCC